MGFEYRTLATIRALWQGKYDRHTSYAHFALNDPASSGGSCLTFSSAFTPKNPERGGIRFAVQLPDCQTVRAWGVHSTGLVDTSLIQVASTPIPGRVERLGVVFATRTPAASADSGVAFESLRAVGVSRDHGNFGFPNTLLRERPPKDGCESAPTNSHPKIRLSVT